MISIHSTEQASGDAVSDSLGDKVGRDVVVGAIANGPERRRDRHGPTPTPVELGDVAKVEAQPIWHTKSADFPGFRQGKVVNGRQRVGQFVERQRRLVTVDPGAFAPEPPYDEILVLTGGKLHEPVDATAHAHEATSGDMMIQQRARIAGVRRLPGRKVALLARGERVQSPSVRVRHT